MQREREMCCKCSNYVAESERRGVVRCHCLKYIYIYIYSEREREMCCKCLKYVRERGRRSERRVWCVVIA